MATFLKRNSVFVAVLAISSLFLLNSCDSGNDGKGVWIPTPPDTSALGKIDHFIPIADIEKFRAAFKVEKDTVLSKIPNLMIPTSETFNKKGLIEILKSDQCVGVRVYYGIKPGKPNEVRLIMVGVDEQGKDLYYEKGSAVATQTGGGRGGSEYGQCDPPCN